MSASREIERLLTDLQYAIVEAEGQIEEMGLAVSEVEVDINTTLKGKVGAEMDLKVVKLGGGVTSEEVNTVSVAFVPAAVVPAASLQGEIVEALKVIEAALGSLERQFSMSSATAEISFVTTADGKISLFVAGEASRAETHTVRLKLTPT